MAHFEKFDGTKIPFSGWIEIQFYSPLFYDTNTYSLPVSIPVTDETRKALDFPEEINSVDNKVREIDCYFIDETLRFIGKLVAETPNETAYEANFIGQGAFWNRYAKLKLNEIEYPTGVFPNLIDVTIKPTGVNDFKYSFGGIDVVFPCFRNLKYYEAFDWYDSDRDKRDYLVNSFEALFHPVGYFAYTTQEIPAIELRGLLKYIFSQLNILLEDKLLDGVLFDNLFLLSNYDVTNVTFNPESGNIYLSQLSIIDAASIQITIPQTDVVIQENDFIKFVNCVQNANYINNRVFRATSVDQYWYDEITGLRSYHITLSIVTLNIINSIGTGTGYVQKVRRAFNLPSTFTFENHIPSITLADLKIFLKSFNLWLVFSESMNAARIVSFDDVLSNKNSIDISDICSKLFDKGLSNITDVILKRSADTDDSYFSGYSKKLETYHTLQTSVLTKYALPTYGNTNHDIRLVETGADRGYYEWFSSLYNLSEGTHEYTGEWRFFAFEIEPGGSGENIDIKFNIPFSDKISARVDIPVNSINTASHNDLGIKLFYFKWANNRPDMDYIGSDYSLLLNGSTSIVNLFDRVKSWKINRYRKAKAYVFWPDFLINDFAWEKKYCIKNTNYLVASFKIKISYDGKRIPGETELVRV